VKISDVTTTLDLLGLLAAVAGLAWAAALLWLPAALLVLGAGLLGISALIDYRARRGAKRREQLQQGGVA
jgi:hypothetical protein